MIPIDKHGESDDNSSMETPRSTLSVYSKTHGPGMPIRKDGCALLECVINPGPPFIEGCHHENLQADVQRQTNW